MSAKFWQWISGIAGSLALLCICAMGSMWNDLQALKQWRAEQWPLEKQLILVDAEQVKARVSVTERKIEDCHAPISR